MISLITILIACIWLGYETDWLTVRLPVGLTMGAGACCEWRLADNQVTKNMKRDLINRWQLTKISLALFKGHYLEPLCGWGFAYQYQSFEPEYKIELITEHAHYTMRTQSTSLLRDAFRVYRNPYIKVKL